MLTVAFTNQKGGVGKTSTVVGVASTLDRQGLRVLCIDMDPQADLTTWLGLDPLDANQLNVNDVIYSGEQGAAAKAVQRAAWGKNLACIGSCLDLADRETDLSPGSEFRLATALRGIDGFDVVLIDCPPSIGRLVVLAFVASSHAVVVTEPSAAALRGVANVMKTIEVVATHYNNSLRLGGIIINHQGRTNESALRVQEIVTAFGPAVWKPYVPVRAIIAAAMGASSAVDAYGSESQAVQEIYVALARKIVDLDRGES